MISKCRKMIFSKIIANAEMQVFLICLAGLLAGIEFSFPVKETLNVLILKAAQTKVSFIGLLSTAVLPFLLAFWLVHFGKEKYLLIVCFCKAFLLSVGSIGCYFAFGQGSWLVRFLLQFSDIVLFPFLCWYAMNNLCGKMYSGNQDRLLCSLAFTVFAGIDYCVVSPFLAMLIDT